MEVRPHQEPALPPPVSATVSSENTMRIEVDKRLNITTVGSILVMAFSLGGWNMLIQTRLSVNERDVGTINAVIKERVSLADQKYQEMELLKNKVGFLDGNLTALTERVGKSFDRIGDRLDMISKTQAEGFSSNASELAVIKTNLAVLQQRVDGLKPERRTELRMPLEIR